MPNNKHLPIETRSKQIKNQKIDISTSNLRLESGIVLSHNDVGLGVGRKDVAESNIGKSLHNVSPTQTAAGDTYSLGETEDWYISLNGKKD